MQSETCDENEHTKRQTMSTFWKSFRSLLSKRFEIFGFWMIWIGAGCQARQDRAMQYVQMIKIQIEGSKNRKRIKRRTKYPKIDQFSFKEFHEGNSIHILCNIKSKMNNRWWDALCSIYIFAFHRYMLYMHKTLWWQCYYNLMLRTKRWREKWNKNELFLLIEMFFHQKKKNNIFHLILYAFNLIVFVSFALAQNSLSILSLTLSFYLSTNKHIS